MNTAPADPKDGLDAFTRESLTRGYGWGKSLPGTQPTIVTSEHTMDEMFDSLRTQTTITATGYSTLHVALDDRSATPILSEDGKRLTQPATVSVTEEKHAFIVRRIDAVDRGRGQKPDFLIFGSMHHEEDGNYYGTNRWTTRTNLKYTAADDRFEFAWEDRTDA